MAHYEEMTEEQMRAELEAQKARFNDYKAKDLSLNMARGNPNSGQLDVVLPMLDILNGSADLHAEDGSDCRNYGVLDGLPEAKRIMAIMLDDEPENVIVFGNSSLSIMYDMMNYCMDFGTCGGSAWNKNEVTKFICPVPGYDRHFSICDIFGIEMIPVPMTPTGPDMDVVEKLVASDENIRGMWNVPKYSNPSGITYSDETVQRLASMKCAADDFRIFWDNAYCVHHLYDEVENQDQLMDIGRACVAAGNPNRYFKFASTSKVTFPGTGIGAMAASPEHIDEVRRRMSVRTIGYDKLNQLRHVRFLKDAEGIASVMSQHAQVIRPRFQLVLKKLDEYFGENSEAGALGHWANPNGGYFVLYNAPEGTAKRAITLCKEVGVTMTPGGSTWPGKVDPHDSDVRIAPTFPSLEDLDLAMDIFACCLKIAYLEKALA